jgi:hypothetical protein
LLLLLQHSVVGPDARYSLGFGSVPLAAARVLALVVPSDALVDGRVDSAGDAHKVGRNGRWLGRGRDGHG